MLPDVEHLAGIVATAIKTATAPLVARISSLEQQLAKHVPVDMHALVTGEVTKAFAELPKPKDGRDGVDGKDGRDGRDAQGLPGKDGIDGKDGRDAIDGKDGMDGLGFDDLNAIYDEHGRLSLEFRRGDQVKSFKVPGHVYREVYSPEACYQKGDTATFAGSTFIAKKDGVLGKPEASDDWKLAVKRGRDSREPVKRG